MTYPVSLYSHGVRCCSDLLHTGKNYEYSEQNIGMTFKLWEKQESSEDDTRSSNRESLPDCASVSA